MDVQALGLMTLAVMIAVATERHMLELVTPEAKTSNAVKLMTSLAID